MDGKNMQTQPHDHKSLTIVCQTSAPDGYEDMEYVAIELTMSLITWLVTLMDLAKDVHHSTAALTVGIGPGDATLHGVTIFCNVHAFYPAWQDDDAEDETLEEYAAAVENGEWVTLPVGYQIPMSPSDVTAASITVTTASVVFAGYHPHSGRACEIESQPLTQLELVALYAQLAG